MVKCFEYTKKSFYKTKLFSLLEIKKRKSKLAENKNAKKQFIEITSEANDISQNAPAVKCGMIGKYIYKVIKHFLLQIHRATTDTPKVGVFASIYDLFYNSYYCNFVRSCIWKCFK